MAGSSSNWFKPSSGKYKGQAVYVQRAGQTRAQVLAGLETGTVQPGQPPAGVAKKALPPPPPAAVSPAAAPANVAKVSRTANAAKSLAQQAIAKRTLPGQTKAQTLQLNIPPRPAKQASVTPAAPGAIPHPTQLQVVKPLGGGSGAQATLVKDAAGNQYVRKTQTGQASARLVEDGYADAAYRALGVAVPNGKVRTKPNGDATKVTEFLSGGRTRDKLNAQERAALDRETRKGFAADALLGNLDVIGSSGDNIMLHNGTAYRVDNGGALRYRATGNPKDYSLWSDYPTEIWNLRDNPHGGAGANSMAVFKPLGIYEIAGQIKSLEGRRTALNQAIPDQTLRGQLNRRLDNMAYVRQVAEGLQARGVNEAKADQYLRDLMRKAKGRTPLPPVAQAIAGIN